MGIVFLFPASCRNCASFSLSNPKYIEVKRNQDSVQVCWSNLDKYQSLKYFSVAGASGKRAAFHIQIFLIRSRSM
jgi:hypothetical protein